MTGPAGPPEIQAAVVRLEQIARLLESADRSPEQMRDLADEALEIAQRVSGLLADALSGESRTLDAGPTGDGAPAN